MRDKYDAYVEAEGIAYLAEHSRNAMLEQLAENAGDVMYMYEDIDTFLADVVSTVMAYEMNQEEAQRFAVEALERGGAMQELMRLDIELDLSDYYYDGDTKLGE